MLARERPTLWLTVFIRTMAGSGATLLLLIFMVVEQVPIGEGSAQAERVQATDEWSPVL